MPPDAYCLLPDGLFDCFCLKGPKRKMTTQDGLPIPRQSNRPRSPSEELDDYSTWTGNRVGPTGSLSKSHLLSKPPQRVNLATTLTLPIEKVPVLQSSRKRSMNKRPSGPGAGVFPRCLILCRFRIKRWCFSLCFQALFPSNCSLCLR